MYLKTDNLVIRNATIEDAPTLCKWWNDGKVMSHAGFQNGLGTSTQIIAEKLSNDNDHNRRLIIEIDTIPIGEMSYHSKDENSVEIGIKICDFAKQEKGYGTIFLKMLIGYLFKEMDFAKIKLDTNLNNSRAQHVYEKVGFKKKGIRIDAWRDQLGVLQTAVDYELVKEDFKG